MSSSESTRNHEDYDDDSTSISSPTHVNEVYEVDHSDHSKESSVHGRRTARDQKMPLRATGRNDINLHPGDEKKSDGVRTSRSSPPSPEPDDSSQRSRHSEGNQRRRSQREEMNFDTTSAPPRFYRSDRSFSRRDDSNRSLGSTQLASFYSSRRSLYSHQDSVKSLEESLTKTVLQVFDSDGNLEKKKTRDISPRRPSKRASIDHSLTLQDNPTPLMLKNDTAPKQPFKRSSIDNSSSNNDFFVAIPITNDESPRYPKQRISLNNGSTRQDIHVTLPSALPNTNDISPRMPQKRASITIVEQEIHVSPRLQPVSSDTSIRQQEIYYTPPSVEDESGYKSSHDSEYDSEYHDCGSSVASELTSPSQIADLGRPQKSQFPHRKPSPQKKMSMVFQQGLEERRHESQSLRNFLASSLPRSVPGGARSLGGRSLLSGESQETQTSYGTRRQGSVTSIMSSQSHLSLSLKVQTLLEMTADVVNSELLDQAKESYQKAIHAAGSEIMNINIQISNTQGDDSPENMSMRSSYHEELRLIGIIIGLLRTKMALLYGADADYVQAIDLCRGAVQVHRHQPALKSVTPNLDDSDDLAGLMLLIIERLENAQTCLEAHKELLDRIDLHSSVSDFSDNESVFSSTKEIVYEMLERASQHGKLAISRYDEDALEMLSVHAAEQDKHDDGIKYLRDSLQIHLVALGMKHPSTGKSLLSIAKMYRGNRNDRNNEELVLGYFQQTAAVLQCSNLGQRARASVLNDIAVIHMRRRDFNEAIKFLLDALHANDEDVDVEEESVSGGRHIATLHVWRNLGECYMQLDNCRNAEGSFLKALEIQRACRKMQDTAEKLGIRAIGVDMSLVKLSSDTSMADTICRIGKARAGGGEHKKALGIYREALVVLNRNAAADKDRPDLEILEKRDQLTQTLYYIAEAESANEDYDKALRMYSLSLKLRNSTGAEQMDKRTTTLIHCLSCFLGIGNVFMKQKEFPKAKKQFKEALSYSLAAKIKETHPIVQRIRQKLKETVLVTICPKVEKLEKKADAEIERGALDMATETLKELLVIRRASLKRLKDNGLDTSEQVYAIACLLQTFGFVFAKNGDDENAERAFKDASRLFRKGGKAIETRACL